MEKPLMVAVSEVKKELIDVINNSNLHPYIIEKIVDEIHKEISNCLALERDKELREYEEANNGN